jgi:predicted aspartyl protease
LIQTGEEKFHPLAIFNVSTLEGEKLSDVVADTGAAISAIVRGLAEAIGAKIFPISGSRTLSQANGSQFSYSGETMIKIRIQDEVFTIHCLVFDVLAFDLIIGNDCLKPILHPILLHFFAFTQIHPCVVTCN